MDHGYWLASKCASANAEYFIYRTHAIFNESVNLSRLADSDGKDRTVSFGVRPVVSLVSDIELKKNENGVWQFIKSEQN